MTSSAERRRPCRSAQPQVDTSTTVLLVATTIVAVSWAENFTLRARYSDVLALTFDIWNGTLGTRWLMDRHGSGKPC